MNVSVTMLDGHRAVGRQEDDHVLPLDRPEVTGGTGLGFNGGHLMLLGWAACFKSTLIHAADARGVTIKRLELSVAGETEDGPYRFARLRMVADLDADCDEDTKAKLLLVSERGCAVSNTLARGAEIEIATA